MTVVTPHVVRGRRLLLGLLATAVLITAVLAGALAPYVVRWLG